VLPVPLALRYCRSPLTTPEGQRGRFRIRHRHLPAGTKATLVTVRMAYLSRFKVRPTDLRLTRDTTVRLLEALQGGAWRAMMADHPAEMYALAEAIHYAKGHVLVGGLGLGYAAAQMARRPAVTRLTVVELEPDVVALAAPYLPPEKPVGVFCRDLDDFLRHPPVAAGATAPERYDTVVLDTWYQTGERQWAAEVVPRLRLVRRLQPGLPRRALWYWGQDEMFGQLRESLARTWQVPSEAMRGLGYTRIPWVFRRGIEDLVPETAAAPKSARDWMTLVVAGEKAWEDPRLRRLVHHFVGDVGTPAWERRFGAFWDEAFPEEG
jgi:hypothetical protein